MSLLRFWHGSGRGWCGVESTVSAKKGRCLHGVGLYLTTSYQTARKYSRGGGDIVEVILSPSTRWLGDQRVSLADAIAFVRSIRGNKAKKAEMVSDLERVARRFDGASLPLSSVNNLLVNYDLSHGINAPKVAAFLVEHGADATLTSPPLFGGSNPGEQWVVVHNPRAIDSARIVKAKEISTSDYLLPAVTPKSPSAGVPRGLVAVAATAVALGAAARFVAQ